MSDAATQIAFVQATWHRSIVDKAREGFTEQIGTHGIAVDALAFFEVPGAFEIPLTAKRLALTGRYRAIVAAGLVVDGGIYRHDFVATAVIDGLMRVQLDTDVPVFSVVLTPHHFHEHDEHIDYFTKHFVKKGAEAANAVAATLALHSSLD
ncbi:6,7-dimethyl-8-ribityllumazine synthase [Mycobacterium sp. DL440]|uniref:6,7-dimethyl-8-ribityllumazine synthase n=1 Tax=Mycobacterium sp. DL440 TaxID=2675523 RepID=UPI001421414A|nr:6,7-dimethyl-8-ribityllumazine synthase [Mycobacterium sp. DL440]